MKKLKKCIFVCFCISMILTMFPTPVWAENEVLSYPDTYQIYPTPHSIIYGQDGIRLNDVNIVITDNADEPTKINIEEMLKSNDIDFTYNDSLSDTKPNIVLGIKDDNAIIQGYFDALSLEDTSALEKLEGYVLSVKDSNIYIMGGESIGLYYGVLTLSQMVSKNVDIKDVLINDYSDNINRGTVEGFYGIPWSFDARKDIIELMGKYKMNQYIYAPKDDPYHFGENWHELYPTKELNEMKQLIDISKDNNVSFIYTLHISNYMDLTDEDDAVNAELSERANPQWDIGGTDEDRGVILPEGQHAIDAYNADETWDNFVAKFEQMYNIGVRRFGILADDISFPVARYSIPYLINFMNRLQDYLMTTYSDVEPLMFCPSYYYQDDARFNGSSYMEYIKDGKNNNLGITNGLDSRIEVMWTGNKVMSNVNSTNSAYLNSWIGRDPLFWWNYPVTDYVPSYVLLGPNPGLEANSTNMTGIISNPMQQGFASEISLFGVADYAWNISGYNRMQSWEDSFTHLFPEIADSLYLIAQHATTGYNTTITVANQESEYLKPYLDAFSSAVNNNDTNAIASAGADLTVQFDELLQAITDVRNNCTSEGLLKDLKPWLNKLENLSTMGNAIIKAYTSSDANEIWDSYSLVNSEMSKWPSITIEQLEGGTVAAEIGIARLTPFIKSLTQELETSLNDLLLTGDTLTNTNSIISNIKDFSATNVIVSGKTYSINNLASQHLAPNRFIGLKLENIYLTDSITLTLGESIADALEVQYSTNGVEWTALEGTINDKIFTADVTNIPMRYVRVINTITKSIDITIESLAVTIMGANPLTVASATSTADIYQGNTANNLVDENYTTPYWTNSNQVPGQEVTIAYDEAFELYDFALYEATEDYIRNGSIYVSEDGNIWTKISNIGANFVIETIDGNDYSVIRGYANGIITKYVKIATESTANNWTKLHEWEVNKTVDIHTGIMNPFNQIADGKATNLIDGDIKTAFKTTSDEGYLNYTLSEFTHASTLSILQNAQNISDAKVLIRATDGWHEIGTLSKAYNDFDISQYRDILELKLEWQDNGIVPQINEIYTSSSEVDKTELATAIVRCKVIAEKIDTDSQLYERVIEALTLAEAVHDYDVATRGMVSDAITKINEVLTIDTTALQALVDQCAALPEGNYKPSSWASFKAILDNANSLLISNEVTQVEIDEMYNILATAKDALQKVADTSALQTYIDQCKALQKDDYIPSSWSAFITALEKAEALLNNQEATQQEVDTMLSYLVTTKERLIKVANKEALQALVNECKTLNAADYTPATWDAFQEIIKMAEEMINNPNATQDDISKLYAQLEKARDALEKIVILNPDEDNKNPNGNRDKTTNTSDPISTSWLTALVIIMCLSGLGTSVLWKVKKDNL